MGPLREPSETGLRIEFHSYLEFLVLDFSFICPMLHLPDAQVTQMQGKCTQMQGGCFSGVLGKRSAVKIPFSFSASSTLLLLGSHSFKPGCVVS
jgi:hypothetical protein